jgi:hypothetical protein
MRRAIVKRLLFFGFIAAAVAATAAATAAAAAAAALRNRSLSRLDCLPTTDKYLPFVLKYPFLLRTTVWKIHVNLSFL